ncbi:hypothetical protein CP989_25890, partial [Enterobacter hormaechei]
WSFVLARFATLQNSWLGAMKIPLCSDRIVLNLTKILFKSAFRLVIRIGTLRHITEQLAWSDENTPLF